MGGVLQALRESEGADEDSDIVHGDRIDAD